MTDVLIKRELLERLAGNGPTSTLSATRELREILAAPRQPEGEGLEVVASQFPEINFSNYGQDEVEALQAWGFTALDAMADAQSVIAELRDRLDVMTQCADNYSRMFEESAEECEASESQAEYQRGRADHFMAERDTLRQQLAERDAELKHARRSIQHMIDQTTPLVPDPDNPGWAKRIQLDDVIAQRDKLAGLLREVRVIVAREVERWTRSAAILPVNANVESGLLTRIDAALAEVEP